MAESERVKISRAEAFDIGFAFALATNSWQCLDARDIVRALGSDCFPAEFKALAGRINNSITREQAICKAKRLICGWLEEEKEEDDG